MAPRKKTVQNSILKDALAHVMLATKQDHEYGKFCRFNNNWIVGYDGVVAAGYRVPDTLVAAVLTEPLKAALDRVGAPYSLTVLQDGALVVRGERLRVTVPGVAIGTLPGVGPDAAIVPVDQTLLNAMTIAAALTTNDRNASVVESSIVLSPSFIYACNGKSILKVYHPCNLPNWFQVPKETLNVLSKVKTPVTHIGFGEGTITFWFGADAWLRSNLYGWNFPDIEQVLAKGMGASEPIYEIQKQLHDALDKLAPFIVGNRLYIVPGKFRTTEDATGAEYDIDHGLPTIMVSYDSFTMATLFGDKIRFTRDGNVWAGDKVTGMFTSMAR